METQKIITKASPQPLHKRVIARLCEAIPVLHAAGRNASSCLLSFRDCFAARAPLAKTCCFYFCLTLLFANTCTAQYIWDERKGCIAAQGNLAPGYLIETKQVSAYVDGDMELFLSDRFAYEGAIWYSFATTHPGQPGVKANDALFAGGEYHFLKPSRWDPFGSLTPGVGLVQVAYNNSEGGITTTPYCAVPLVSMSLGCNYYVGWIFHFFVKVQGVVGQTFSDMPTPQRIDEIKFTFGLGLNSRVWKPRKRDKWKEGMM